MKTRFPKMGRSGAQAQQRHSTRRRSRRGATSGEVPLEGSPDRATQRIREAGGPIDRASYSCECGFVFVAEVSTTVHCPCCKAGQAW